MGISGITLFLIIGCLICYVAAYDIEETQKECGVNQEYRSCGTYSYCEPTCQKPEGQPCPKICVQGCFCRANYIRERTDGICINKNRCRGGC